MRGQYAHNHGVLSSSAPRGAYHRFIELGLQHSTLATWLNDAGYATFYAGKFLNDYNDTSYVPPGWSRWFAFSGNEGGVSQTRFLVNENGVLKRYINDQQHETYYLRDRAEAFVRKRAQGNAPWFAWVSTHAPHGPHTIAPEFLHSYNQAKMPKPPSYNEADVSDKPVWIQSQQLLDSECSTDKGKFDCHKQVVKEWRARQETLMSVDVMVGDLMDALAETGQLENTYVVFASDNGYMLYRHRVSTKGTPYEEAQGVPFVVRGPGVQQGVVRDELVANIDLAPTIAEWAGVQAPEYVDGSSLAPLLEGTSMSWRQHLLFEHYVGHHYDGLRTTGGETYIEHENSDKEYYDLTKDPGQLDSAHAAPENAQRLGTLSEMLSNLKGCAGEGCRAADRVCSSDLLDNDGDGEVDEAGEPCGNPHRPQTTIDAGPPDSTNSRSATFSFSSSDKGSSFECSLDGAEFASCNPQDTTLTSKTYDTLADGRHGFSVRAINRGGYVDPDPARHTWTVDTTAPTVSSVFPSEGARRVPRNTDVMVVFSEAMEASTINGGTFWLKQAGTTERTLATVTPDPANASAAILDPQDRLTSKTTYVVTVTRGAKDLAGNVLDQDPATSGNQQKVWRFRVG